MGHSTSRPTGNWQDPSEHHLTTMDGKFILKSNENYDAFLKAVGVPDELAAKMVAAVPTVEVSTTATTSTMVVKAGDKTYTNTITYGQDSPYSGSISLGGKTGTIEVKKTADGYCQCMTVGGSPARDITRSANIGDQSTDVISYVALL